MKKALLGVIAVAIVALAAFNLNLALNKEAKVSVDLSNPVSLAQGEGGEEGRCLQKITHTYLWECWYWTIYACNKGGNELYCDSGDLYYDMCFPPMGIIDEVETLYCPKL